MHRREIFWGKLLQKSHKNQTQKTQLLDQNAVKIVLFEKKTFFNFCSIFVKKKQYSIVSKILQLTLWDNLCIYGLSIAGGTWHHNTNAHKLLENHIVIVPPPVIQPFMFIFAQNIQENCTFYKAILFFFKLKVILSLYRF